MFKSLLIASAIFAVACSVEAAAQAKVSECMAIADRSGGLLHYAALSENEARLQYAGHSTFILESAGGVKIATDYAGHAGGLVPDVATMNHAHSSHYTDAPDPAIKHVLRGWGEGGSPARHDLDVGDVRIRNVPTDIRFGGEGREKDGNSIFIFEVAGLCIGHLGHLHHELSPGHISAIGSSCAHASYCRCMRALPEVSNALKRRQRQASPSSACHLMKSPFQQRNCQNSPPSTSCRGCEGLGLAYRRPQGSARYARSPGSRNLPHPSSLTERQPSRRNLDVNRFGRPVTCHF